MGRDADVFSFLLGDQLVSQGSNGDRVVVVVLPRGQGTLLRSYNQS